MEKVTRADQCDEFVFIHKPYGFEATDIVTLDVGKVEFKILEE